MKKIMNNPKNYVKEMHEGILKSDKNLSWEKDNNIIYKCCINENKVSLVSGGGAGHEPSHAGYVGKGMLDAAVSGEIFTSPTPNMIKSAIQKTKTKKGTLLIIKNYSGDIMNFKIAKELLEEDSDEFNIEYVVVDDDVAVKDSLYTTGRRGIAGTILVHKMAGSLAEEGKTLLEVKDFAKKVIDNTKTMGMSLGGCQMPENKEKSFNLKEDEMEIGLGIHGEPGVRKTQIQKSKDIVKILLDIIINDFKIKPKKVALIINGLGGTPLSELYIVNKDAHQYLEESGIEIDFNKVGNYMTSLEMPGFSITLLNIWDEVALKHLETETNAKGW